MLNMYSNLEQFMKSYINIDNEMLENIMKFRRDWSVKRIDANSTNLDFLSDITIGEQSIRFSHRDDVYLCKEILKIDMDKMQEDLYLVDGIDKDWNVASNVIYVCMLYIIRHIIINGLDIKYLKEVFYILCYKMITSLISGAFSYPVEPNIALVVKERMSNKFLLKQLGSWQAYFEHRSTFYYPNTKFGDRLKNEYSAKVSVDSLANIQTHIRSTFVRLFRTLDAVAKGKEYIDSDGLAVDAGEEIVISNVKNNLGKYKRIALEKIHSQDFIIDDYIYLLTEVSTNLNVKSFKSILESFSQNTLERYKELDELVDDTIRHSITYLFRIDQIDYLDKNPFGIIQSLRSYYTTSSVKDEEVKSLKERYMKIVEDNSDVKTEWVKVTLAINILLYVMMLAILKR